MTTYVDLTAGERLIIKVKLEAEAERLFQLSRSGSPADPEHLTKLRQTFGSDAAYLRQLAAKVETKVETNDLVPVVCFHGLSTDVPCMDCPPNGITTPDGRTISI